MSDKEILIDDLDDDKTIAFIKNYLPQDIKEKYSKDQYYYLLDLIDEYYIESGILESEPDDEGFVEIDVDDIVKFIIKESKKDEMGEFDSEEVLLIVQAEMEYGNTLGLVD